MTTDSRTRRVRIAAVSGTVAPLAWTILVLMGASLRPGYSHLTQYISELGFGPNSIIQTANFLIVGSLIIIFALGLQWGIGKGQGLDAKVGPSLVVVIGVGLIGAGLFPGDPSSSFSYSMHALFSVIVFFVGPFGPIFMWRRLSKDSQWRRYRYYSLATGILMYPAFLNPLSGPWPGLTQRVTLFILFLWIEIIAIQLLRKSKAPRPVEAASVRPILPEQEATLKYASRTASPFS